MMKKEIILSMLTLFAIANIYATVWTVNNAPNGGMQFTTLQAAHDAAQAGDTLYVSGSEVGYGVLNIQKELHVIGAGFDPVKQASASTIISQIYLDTIQGISGASNSSIEGVILYAIDYPTYNYVGFINNIRINRCNINGMFMGLGMTNHMIIDNCIIYSQLQYGASSRNLILSNNIIIVHPNRPVFHGFNDSPTHTLCYNNIFMGENSTSSLIVGPTKRIIFNNNIFHGMKISDPFGNQTPFEICDWNNNLSYGFITPISFPIDINNNSGANNLEGVDPLFMNCPAFFTYDNSYDFHLQEGSPCIGAGAANTDIGLYGGPTPFIDGGGMPAIPQITKMTILNSTLPADASLEVEVKAHSQQ